MTNSSVNPEPKKYFFDAEFDHSETVADIQSITPKQHAADIESAKQTAYEEGIAKGTSDTNDSIARIASDQLFVITSKLEDLVETEAKVMNVFHQQVTQVSELVTRKLLPVLAEQGAIAEVIGVLDQIKSDLPTDQRVTITVHPSLQAEIEAHFKTIDTKNSESNLKNVSITVASDASYQLTDCSASWEGAGITQYIETTHSRVQDALLRLAKTPLEFKDSSPGSTSDSDLNSDQIESENDTTQTTVESTDTTLDNNSTTQSTMETSND